jgi:predicted nucleic acid-binding protein
MRVLVDTCIWSLALRRREKGSLSADEVSLIARLTESIQEGNVVMIGPIRQEVLSGIKDESQFEKTERLLAPFPDEELGSDFYVEAARLFNLCRRHGVQCGPVDMLICSVAVRKRCMILTSDEGLTRCVDVLRKNKMLPAVRSEG